MKTENEKITENITVKIQLSGEGSLKEKKAALSKMLTRCHPIAFNGKIYFLEAFKVST